MDRCHGQKRKKCAGRQHGKHSSKIGRRRRFLLFRKRLVCHVIQIQTKQQFIHRKTDENHIRFICGGKLPAGAGFVFCATAMTRIPSAFNSKDIKKPPPRKDTLRKRWLFEFIHRKIICDQPSVFISKKSLIFTLRIPFLLRLISSIDTTYLG